MLFESGEAVLSPSSHELLKKIGMIINGTHARVDIQGHTDDQPIRTRDFPSMLLSMFGFIIFRKV